MTVNSIPCGVIGFPHCLLRFCSLLWAKRPVSVGYGYPLIYRLRHVAAADALAGLVCLYANSLGINVFVVNNVYCSTYLGHAYMNIRQCCTKQGQNAIPVSVDFKLLVYESLILITRTKQRKRRDTNMREQNTSKLYGTTLSVVFSEKQNIPQTPRAFPSVGLFALTIKCNTGYVFIKVMF